jgi:hypothetical protein
VEKRDGRVGSFKLLCESRRQHLPTRSPMLQVLSSSACGARKLNHGQWIRNGLYRGHDNDDNNARGTFGGVLCVGYEVGE